jgi:hypothetical protein
VVPRKPMEPVDKEALGTAGLVAIFAGGFLLTLAGELLRTCTRPTLNLLLLLRAHVSAFTHEGSHAPILVECSF